MRKGKASYTRQGVLKIGTGISKKKKDGKTDAGGGKVKGRDEICMEGWQKRGNDKMTKRDRHEGLKG